MKKLLDLWWFGFKQYLIFSLNIIAVMLPLYIIHALLPFFGTISKSINVIEIVIVIIYFPIGFGYMIKSTVLKKSN